MCIYMVVVARSYYTLYMRAARVVCWCTQRALAWFLPAPGLAPAPAPAPGFAPTPDTPVVARMPEHAHRSEVDEDEGFVLPNEQNSSMVRA